MKTINCTPHAIVLIVGDRTFEIPPSGIVPRCKTARNVVDEVEVEGIAVPITETVMGELEGMPEAEEGTLYIVSMLAATAARRLGRTDVVVPDDAVRDKDGKIVGCRALAR